MTREPEGMAAVEAALLYFKTAGVSSEDDRRIAEFLDDLSYLAYAFGNHHQSQIGTAEVANWVAQKLQAYAYRTGIHSRTVIRARKLTDAFHMWRHGYPHHPARGDCWQWRCFYDTDRGGFVELVEYEDDMTCDDWDTYSPGSDHPDWCECNEEEEEVVAVA